MVTPRFVPSLAVPEESGEALTVVVHRDGVAVVDLHADEVASGAPRLVLGTLDGVACWPVDLDGDGVPGETLEETVHREVREEVGVGLSEVRYVESQLRPFPHSLMVGFEATWSDGELAVDGEEILEAAWYRPDRLPGIPRPMSIARTLIERWLARHD